MKWAIVIHGGAGSIPRTYNNQPQCVALKRILDQAVRVIKGEIDGVLKLHSPNASRALAAAVEAVVLLEDEPLFNAGRGSCLNNAGKCELEAAVMDSTLSSGACCGLTTVKNPVLLAEHISRTTPHRFIGFAEAEEIAKQAELEREDPEWFYTETRQKQLEKMASQGGIARDHDIQTVTKPVGLLLSASRHCG